MASKLELVALGAAAVAVGTIYVIVHEARRKRRKAEKAAAEAPITKEMLLKILNRSAETSKAVIERVCQSDHMHSCMITACSTHAAHLFMRRYRSFPCIFLMRQWFHGSPLLILCCIDPCRGAQDTTAEKPE